MRGLLRRVARDLTVLVVICAILWLGLRGYIHHKVATAESLAYDFHRLITTNPTKHDIDEFNAKYRLNQRNGVVVVTSPQLPLLTKPDDYGWCKWEHRGGNGLLGTLVNEAWLRIARSAGFACFELSVLNLSLDTNGEVGGFLQYRPMNGRSVWLAKYPYQGRSTTHSTTRPYGIAETGRSGEAMVGIWMGTPQSLAAAITSINGDCFYRYDGCSFAEILPGAAAQLAHDGNAR